jgi:putative ABC transport system substrate-binding protein
MSLMIRLAIVILLLLTAPLVAEAQQSPALRRVGCIPAGPLEPRKHQWDAFRQSLRDLGWIEGRNIVLEFRPPAREGAPFDDLVADLVRLKVDVIVATSSAAVRAAKRATSTIPIVMSPSADPVEQGLVNSLARPGGNVTGLSLMAVDLSAKRLEILREIVPGVFRIAVLWRSPTEAELRAVQAAARTLALEIIDLHVAQAEELSNAFEAARQRRAGAMVVIQNPLFFGLRAQVSELALKHRLPAIYALPSYAPAGGLVVYGPSDTEYYRRAAVYVDKILNGAKASDLPVEQPTKVELLINMRTAKALGLTIPPSLLLRADQVIE